MIDIKMIAGILLLTTVVLYGVSGFTSVNPGETALQIKMLGENRGMQDETLDTGTFWIEPLAYDVEIYDTRFQQYSLTDVETQTKDGQPVIVDVSLEIGLIDASVPWIHEHIGKDYWEKIIYPALRSAIRSEVPSQLSDQVYTATGRKLIQLNIQKILVAKFGDNGFLITVNLRDINFTNAGFIQVLERKAMASQQVIIEERNAEAAKNIALKTENIAEGEKQRVIKEAEATRMKSKLEGEGYELKKKAEARGNLAIYQSEAENVRLKVKAYGNSDAYVSVAWAENMGANVKVLGYPLGAPGTTGLFNVEGILGNALKIQGAK